MTNKKTEADNLEDLLAEVTAEETAETPLQKTATLQQRIAELEALIEKPEEAEPLSTEERRIRELELAIDDKKNQLDRKITGLADLKDGDHLLIHVLIDGMSIAGRVWQKHSEIEFTVGSQEYNEQFHIDGTSWLELLFNEEDQIAKYGEVRVRLGESPNLPVFLPCGIDSAEATLRREAAFKYRVARRRV